MHLRAKPVFPLLALLMICCSEKEKSAEPVNNPSERIVLSFIPRPLFWKNKPKSFSIQENGVTIEAGEKTDMFRDPNATYNTDNVPKLLFPADSNFVLSCAIEHGFANKWDGGALVLMSDSVHWIKFCFEKDYTGAKRVVSVVTRNISDDCNSVAMDANKAFFKMAKADRVVTLYCSKNGSDWLLIRHFQFETSTGFNVGFLAQSPTGPRCEVKFSDISYRVIKIKDPYLGN